MASRQVAVEQAPIVVVVHVGAKGWRSTAWLLHPGTDPAGHPIAGMS